MALSAESPTMPPMVKGGNKGNKPNRERSQERDHFEARTRRMRKTLFKKKMGRGIGKTNLRRGELRPLIIQRSKSRDIAKTNLTATSAKMGKEGKDSTSWNGERNSFDAFAQKKSYMFHNAGNSCYLGSSMRMLLITGLDI